MVGCFGISLPFVIEKKIVEAEKAKSDFMEAGGNKLEKTPKPLSKEAQTIKEAHAIFAKIDHDGSEEAQAAEAGYALAMAYTLNKN